VLDAVQKEAMETIPGIRRLQIKEMGSDVMASSQAPVLDTVNWQKPKPALTNGRAGSRAGQRYGWHPSGVYRLGYD